MNTKKYPKRLAELFDVFTSMFLREGCDKEQAEHYAELALSELAINQGGKQLYLPKAETIRAFARNKKIYAEYKSGVSVDDLANRYSLTVSHIYALIEEQRQANRNQTIQAHEEKTKKG